MFKILFLSLFLASCQTSHFWNTEPYYECDVYTKNEYSVYRVKFPASKLSEVRLHAEENGVFNIKGPFNVKK